MDIFSDLRNQLYSYLKSLQEEKILAENSPLGAISLERPKNPSHGELSTNAAIVLKKFSTLDSRALSEKILEKLASLPEVQSVSTAGPGFINFTLSPRIWKGVIPASLNNPDGFGKINLGKGQKINLEFVSANPTGPLHIAHTRGAVFGDTLARLLEFTGHCVTREYYVNDGGNQVDTLARSAFKMYEKVHQSHVNDKEETSNQGNYVGEYLVQLGSEMKKEFGAKFLGKAEEEWLEEIKEFAISRMLGMIKRDLERLGIFFDNFVHEKNIYQNGYLDQSIDKLNELGLIYDGVLPPPKGKQLQNWEPREQTLFKSTEFGDDVDRPIKKADGNWAYFAPDIGYHYDKIKRGYPKLINVLGNDHGGYVKRLKAVVKALSDDKVELEIKIIQIVNVIEGGAKSKMSKRAGNFVLQSKALDAVGADVTRFVLLMRKNDAPLDFDFQKVQEQSKDNPVFYVQYAHARVCSLLQRAEEAGFSTKDISLLEADLELLSEPEHIIFIRRLAEWPRAVYYASHHAEPHRIALYLVELASEFHALWAKANEKEQLRILKTNNRESTIAGLAMARATAIIIRLGLSLLGVKPMTKM